MAEQLDTSSGSGLDARTWIEPARKDGQCCQPQEKIEALPADGQGKARARLAKPG